MDFSERFASGVPRGMATADMHTERNTALIKALRRIFGRSSQSSLWDSQEIIRAEIFGSERFEQHAESLAVAQKISPRPKRGRSLRRRLHDNDRTLLRAYETIAASIDLGRPITPAAEWLVDNYHIVEDQIREIRDDLPVDTVLRFLGVVLDGLVTQQGAGFPIDVEGTLLLVRSALSPS